MDNLNPNQMPPMTSMIPEKKSSGPLISVIVILALIIIGGLYFLKEKVGRNDYMMPSEDNITTSLQTQNSSDELSAIEADLNSTNVENLDQGAAVIETELQ